jgi:ELWxxDGT repeat protein
MRFRIEPFEERILLDAAGMTQVANAYDQDHSQNYDDADQHNTQTDHPGATATNTDAVDGRVLVVSSQIKDSTLLADATKDGVTVVQYDFNVSLDNLAQQISAALDGKQASSIGFALMGADGQFFVTSDVYVTLSTLATDDNIQTFWKEVGGMVQNGGSIDILSCNVAIDTSGLSLIHMLDSIVDDSDAGHYISVNASIDKTGSTDFGGNWYLEVGGVDAIDRYFDSTRIQQWNHLLDTPIQLIEINGGTASSSPSNFFEWRNPNEGYKTYYFFTATTAAAGTELWVTDATAAGTHIVADINPGTASSNPNSFVYAGAGDDAHIYFIATSGTDTTVWKANTTSASQVLNINTSGNDAVTNLVTDESYNLYFVATAPTTGAEVYNYYIPSSITSVFDVRAGSTGSSPTQLVMAGSNVYFVANNGTIGAELYKNGTLVMDIRPGATGSSITGLAAYSFPGGPGMGVVFSANDGTNGAELWKSNSAGTSMISNINAGSASSSPANFSFYTLSSPNTGFLFTATTAAAGTELWNYNNNNGTETVSIVSDIVSGTGSSNAAPLSSSTYNSLANQYTGFFTATTAAAGTELWYYRPGGSAPVMLDIVSGTGSSSPQNATAGWGNSNILSGFATSPYNIYFTATTAAAGRELWMASASYDGSAITAAQVADIFSGTTGSNPTSIRFLGGLGTGIPGRYLFFSATGSTAAGAELWVMDMDTAPTGSNQSYTAGQNTTLNVSSGSGVLGRGFRS